MSYIENALGEMSESSAEVCRSLGKVRGGLGNVCGGLGDVCGSLGKVVYCEVYKNLTKEMKTIQWER